MKNPERERCKNAMLERYRAGGLEDLDAREALEWLLFYVVPKANREVAQRLLDRYGSLDNVLRTPVEALEQVEGVNERAAVLLSLPFAISRRAQGTGNVIRLKTAEDAGKYLIQRLRFYQNEMLCQLCLDNRYRLRSFRYLKEGSATSVSIDIREMIQNALLSSSSHVILGHNHPSGCLEPSEEDLISARYIFQALRSVHVSLCDFIIVSGDSFVSVDKNRYAR